MRVCYSLAQLRRPEDGFEPLAEHDVDPASADALSLLEGLQLWAVRELTEHRCQFGLYIAEFGTYDEHGAQLAFLRELSIIWDGTEIIAVHINHGPTPAKTLHAALT